MSKTPIDEPIAEERFVLLQKGGGEVEVIAMVGKPYKEDRDSWACPAALIGIDGQYPDIVGASSLQALSLAIQLIRRRLCHTLEDNEEIYYPEDKSEKLDIASLDAIFGRSGA